MAEQNQEYNLALDFQNILQIEEDNEHFQNILIQSEVHPDWLAVFNRDAPLRESLLTALENQRGVIPGDARILRALSLCSPQDVKVVLLGHEPIYTNELATGFSFSFPQGQVDNNVSAGRNVDVRQNGNSIRLLHNALCAAGFLEEGGNYSMNHEEWCRRGVLLLNGSLTYNFADTKNGIWTQFVTLLVSRVAELRQNNNTLFILCWGNSAHIVGQEYVQMLRQENINVIDFRHNADPDIPEATGIINYLNDHMELQIPDDAQFVDTLRDQNNIHFDQDVRRVVFFGDHPTFPRDNTSAFHEEARLQFLAVFQYYPDLFRLNRLNPLNVPPAVQRPENVENGREDGGQGPEDVRQEQDDDVQGPEDVRQEQDDDVHGPN